jgi:glycosyltransferase involved in cell wall biosynthesis
VTTPVPIYQVVLRLACGGLEKMVVHLAQALDPARFRVTVCCLEEPGELAVELEGTGIPVVSLAKQGLDPRVFVRLAHRLRRDKVRVVHTHNPGAHLYGLVGAKLAGVPVVVHTRHGPGDDPGLRRAFTHPWWWRQTGATVAVSDNTATVLAQQSPIPPERLLSITNGVPVPQIRAEDRVAIRAEFGIPPVAPTVGIVARLAPEKEHRTLLSAFARLRRDVPDAHLLIVGDGPLRKELERQAVELKIQDCAHFAGFRRDVHRTLAAMDTFVLCSTFEGTALTLLEAMGARLPVVATAVGGNPEVLGGPENGWLVPTRDVDALAQAMTVALTDSAAARDRAERAHTRMLSLYGVETMALRYETLYERLLQSLPAVAVPTSGGHEDRPGRAVRDGEITSEGALG